MSSDGAVDLTQSKQSDLRTLLIAMTIVPTVIVLIRAWSRFLLPVTATSKIPTKFWWDDWAAFAAAALNIAVCGICLKLVDYGLGLHIEAVPPEKAEKFPKILGAFYYIYDTATAVGKSSALFFYARIFSMSHSRFKYALWLVHFMNAVWLLVILLCVTFTCNPIQKAWETSLPGTCLNTGIMWTGSGATSLIIDVIILLLPLPMLWKLQIKTIRKIQISGVFLCGYLVVVVSIGRLVAIIEAGDEVQIDPTYKIATAVLWLGSETAISVISVSLPSVFFLAQRVRSQGLSSLFTTRTHASQSTHSGTHGPHYRFHDDEDDRLVSRSTNHPYVSRTKTTAAFGGPIEGNESIGHGGIHVMHDIEVA